MARKMRLFPLIVVLAMLLVSCGTSKKQAQFVPYRIAKNANLNQYVINAELNTTDKVLTVSQQIKYVNNDNVSLKELYFHLYPNAFKHKETAPFLFGDFENAYKRGFSPGYTDITSISLLSGKNRAALEHSLTGEGLTIMKVPLPEPLAPGAAAVLEINFAVKIPPAGERFGYGEHNFNLGNWYPVAAVYDKNGWNLDKYYPIGDPFYSDSADYTVNIKAPKDYVIAASGRLTSEKLEGKSKLWRFEANSMRDFAFIANNSFETMEKAVGGTMVKSYYYKGDRAKGKDALDYGVKSIQIFNDSFGKYPFPSYSVVETEFPSGMEYPGLVYISDDYYKKSGRLEPLMYTVVHETAHQWWYSLIGNDQIDEAWLDEGFASYSEAVFTEKEFGKQQAENYMRGNEESANMAISEKYFDGVVLKSLSQFTDWSDYSPAVYDKGSVTLYELRKRVGDRVFFEILKTYFKEFEFGIATTQDFIKVSEKVSGKELDSFFDTWLKAK